MSRVHPKTRKGPRMDDAAGEGVAPAKAKRKALSQKVRFEVFKRDKFACQYCGAKAPEVILQVDHIRPVALDGANDALNLLTSCVACNGGKGATSITDGSALDRQREQLEALEERRQQIEMMLQWRTELTSQNVVLLEAAAAAWEKVATGYNWTEIGRAKVAAALKKHGLAAVFDAIDSVGDRFPSAAAEKVDAATIEKMFKHLLTVLKYGNDPNGQGIAYTIGILRNRCDGRQRLFFADLKLAADAGLSVERMKEVARDCDSWEEFEDWCASAVGGLR